MAEFDAVVKECNRMCDKLDKNCDKCPLKIALYGTPYSCDKYLLRFPVRAEAIIMKWAAENPEPIYPSWYEYLKGRGLVVSIGGSFYAPKEQVLTLSAFKNMSERDGKMLGLKPFNVLIDKYETEEE